MQVDRERQLVHAYVDGEMELVAQLAFEERLAREPELREQVARLRALSETLRRDADYHAAPEALRRQLARQLAQGRAPAAARWFAWRPLLPAFALALLAATAVDLVLVQGQDARRQRDELVASHVRAALTQRPIDVASSDQHTVKPWFSSQLDFSPPVAVPPGTGAVLLGGRVDYVDGRKVAVLVYRQGRHTVDHFVWPDAHGDSTPSYSMLQGFRIAQWTAGGLAHRMVSDLAEDEFRQLVQACRAQG